MIGHVRGKTFIRLRDAMIDIVANVGKQFIKGMSYVLFGYISGVAAKTHCG